MSAGVGETTLQVMSLSKVYGKHQALSGLTFTAQAGEVVGLVGPNGAGKTTTLRILSTLLEPTSGEFWVAGIPGVRPNEVRRRIGVLPESVGYAGGRTGYEYLRFFGQLFGLDRTDADRHARTLLEEFGLLERADWPISTYSRGMRQRLGIARAVVNDPAVVFLDEPTLGLDPAGQEHVLSLVRNLAGNRGSTVVLSTHALPVVEEICDRVVVLDRGRVALSGTLGEVSAAVGSGRSIQLRVPPELVNDARHALAASVGRAGIEIIAEPSGLLTVHSLGPDGTVPWPDGDPSGPVLLAVLNARIPVLWFDVGGGRLSDAFLSITAGNGR